MGDLETFFNSDKEKRSQQVLAVIRRDDRRSTTYYHAASSTLADDAKLTYIPGSLCKTTCYQDEGKSLFLLSQLPNTQFNLAKIANKCGATGTLAPADPVYVNAALGIDLTKEPEDTTLLSPLNILLDKRKAVTLVLDAVLMREAQIRIHPMNDTCTSVVTPNDLNRFLNTVE